MSDLICLNCEHYNMVTERCYKLGFYIPSTDESGSMCSCMYKKPMRINKEYFWKSKEGDWGDEMKKPEDFIKEKDMTI